MGLTMTASSLSQHGTDLDCKLLPRASMNAPLAGGVGAIAEDVLLDLIVVLDGGGAHWEGGAKLEGGREGGREGCGGKRGSE